MANSIKTFKDGNRMVIVVENITGKTASLINKFIMEALELSCEEEIEHEELLDLVPTQPKEDEEIKTEELEPLTKDNLFKEPLTKEEVLNIELRPFYTIGEAIKEKDTQALVEHSIKAKTEEEIDVIKEYIYKDCSSRETEWETHSEIRKFIITYKPLIENLLSQILDFAGYATIEDFLDFADIVLQIDAYRSIVDAMIERTKK